MITRNKGVEVKLGDWVMSANKHFEPIYSFGHRNEKMQAAYLRILPSGLELSGNHMVFIALGGMLPLHRLELL